MPYFQVHVKYNIYLKVSIKYKYKYSSNLYLLHLSTSPTVLDPNPGRLYSAVTSNKKSNNNNVKAIVVIL